MMKQTMKVLCIISVFLPASAVYACCGMVHSITDDPVVAACTCEAVTISGSISGTDIMTLSGTYSLDLSMDIAVTDPCGAVTNLTVTLTNTLDSPPNAAFDFEATYTPTVPGTYTYVKTTTWTTPFPWTETASAAGDFTLEECVVDIDIKPGSCPNPFNAKSKGSIPVAIVGSADLDVTTIDPTSLTLNGVPALEEYEILGDEPGEYDPTQPGDYNPEDCYDCFDADDPANFNCDLDPLIPGLDAYCGDGYPDLIVKFDTQALAAAIGAAARDDCVVLTLEGLMLDGSCIVGSDSVVIKTKIKD